jgi:putative ABC transport system substrate-binding protein
MERRTFIGVIAGGLLAAPLAVEAQQAPPKVAKIGVLDSATVSSLLVEIEPFKQSLRERGWNEGQNLTLVFRSADGHYERLPALARDLLDLGVDVIVSDSTPSTRAALQVPKTVPIVMAATGDPVGMGLAKSLARPGGNVTGVSFFMPEINAKRLELLKEAAPRIARVAVVYNPLNPADESAIVAIETTAKTLHVRIERLEVRALADLETVFSELRRQRVDAVMVVEDRMIRMQSLRVVEVALKEKLPAVFFLPDYVVAGGLMSYAPNRPDLWQRGTVDRQDPSGREARRPTHRAADAGRVRHQPQDRQGDRAHDSAIAPTASGSAD